MKRTIYILMYAILVAGCAKDDENISMVKGGTLQICPNITVNKMVNSFMGNPSWESGTGSNNAIFVNVSGDITYSNKPVKGVLQFLVDKKNSSFQYNAFEINGVPQDNLTASGLLEKMCGTDLVSQQQSSEPENYQGGDSVTSYANNLADNIQKSRYQICQTVAANIRSFGNSGAPAEARKRQVDNIVNGAPSMCLE